MVGGDMSEIFLLHKLKQEPTKNRTSKKEKEERTKGKKKSRKSSKKQKKVKNPRKDDREIEIIAE